jgi:cytochrome c biogenesis factor
MFYNLILIVHNWVRWLVLLAGAWALIRAFGGWLGNKPWSPADRQAGMLFGIAVDLQFLLGLLLAFVSPLVAAALGNLGAAMASETLRFFLAEHIPLMLLALIVIHAGSAFARKGSTDRDKHRRAALLYALGALFIVVAIPWWRPLLRGL